MKSKLTIGLTLLATSMFSQAVVVQYQTTFSQAVVDTSGAIIPDQGGFTAVGIFSVADGDLPSLTSTDLANAFQIFGASSVFGFNEIGGVYDSTASGGRVGPAVNSQFLGMNIYVINTNGADIASSTQALIFRSNLVFPNDSQEALDASVLVQLGTNGSYVFGGTAGDSVELAPGFSVPTIQMATIIPEPSVALLGAFGILGLLRRRR